MKKIGLIGAMQVEIAKIKAAMTDVNQQIVAGNEFFEGKLGNQAVVLTCSGIGKVNAALTAQVLISQFGCDCIINTGIAGNLSPQLSLGDFVVADCVKYHDFDPSIFAQCHPFVEHLTPDKNLVLHICQSLRDLKVTYLTGTIATGDVFVEDAVTKQRIIDTTAGLCAEMEGAAIGHVATKNGVPFGIIRCISDNSDDAAVYENFFDTAADLSADIAIHTIASLAK